MSLHIVLLSFSLETSASCDNVGPCCFSCPEYDQCDQHYDPDAPQD